MWGNVKCKGMRVAVALGTLACFLRPRRPLIRARFSVMMIILILQHLYLHVFSGCTCRYSIVCDMSLFWVISGIQFALANPFRKNEP